MFADHVMIAQARTDNWMIAKARTDNCMIAKDNWMIEDN